MRSASESPLGGDGRQRRPRGSRAPGCGTRTSVSTWWKCVVTPTSASSRKFCALVVGHPLLVEEHVRAGEPELVGQRAGLDRHAHLGDVGVGVAACRGTQPHVGRARAQLVDGPDQRQRIEPVVDAAAPEDDLVVGADAGDDAPDARPRCARGLVRDAERHDVDERRRGRVGVVGGRVDPAERRQVPEPEVALLGAGAQEEVAPQQLLVEHGGGVDCTARRRAGSRRRGPARASRWNGS